MDGITSSVAQRLVGKTVSHRAFGSGVIEDCDGGTITVNFPKGDKKFIYPDAFENFLKFEDKETVSRFNQIMDKRREKIQAQRDELVKKDETRRKIMAMKIVPQSHTVFALSEEELAETEKRGAAFTGLYRSGYQEGRPRQANRVQPNSACILTTLPQGAEESERLVRGLFMVREDYFGEHCRNGMVKAHDSYRLYLEPSQALSFWDKAESSGKPKRFGSMCFRYTGDGSVINILQALINSGDEKLKEQAERFLSYFCSINRIKYPTQG